MSAFWFVSIWQIGGSGCYSACSHRRWHMGQRSTCQLGLAHVFWLNITSFENIFYLCIYFFKDSLKSVKGSKNDQNSNPWRTKDMLGKCSILVYWDHPQTSQHPKSYWGHWAQLLQWWTTKQPSALKIKFISLSCIFVIKVIVALFSTIQQLHLPYQLLFKNFLSISYIEEIKVIVAVFG